MVNVKVYTRTGDKGQTALLGGSRTSKADRRVWTYGTIDEANSVIGLARSVINEESIKNILMDVQKKLFQVGAELASIGTKAYKERIFIKDVEELEVIIDSFDSKIKLPNTFIVPGGSYASAQLDVARTTIRKAERYAVLMSEEFEINQELMKYINRLSDMLYVLGRYIDFKDIVNKAKSKVEDKIIESKGLNKAFRMNREFGRKIIDACIEKACEIEVPMVICVTDDSGNIIALERMDDALLVSLDIAKDKAYTACAFKASTDKLREMSLPSGELYGIGNLKNVITFGGGVPLKICDKVVGAIGISGGSVQEDITVAEHGVKIFKEAF